MEREEGNIEENLSEKFKRLKLKTTQKRRPKPTLKITQMQSQEEEEEEKTKNVIKIWKPSPLESKLEVSRKQEEYDIKIEQLIQILDSFKSQAVAIFNGFGDGDFFEHEHRVSMMYGHLNSMYKTYEILARIEQYLRKIGELFAKELISIKDEQMRAEEEINKLNFIIRELKDRIPKVYLSAHKHILEQIELRGEMIEEFIKKNELISKSNNKTKDQDDEMLDKYNKTLVAIEVIKPEIEYMNETIKKIICEKDNIISKLNELLMANILDIAATLGISPDNNHIHDFMKDKKSKLGTDIEKKYFIVRNEDK